MAASKDVARTTDSLGPHLRGTASRVAMWFSSDRSDEGLSCENGPLCFRVSKFVTGE